MTIEEKIKFISKKVLSLSIDFNDHKNCYSTITGVFNSWDVDDEDIIDKEEMIKNNEMWNVRIYPDTPIGFYTKYAPTLEKALDAILELINEN